MNKLFYQFIFILIFTHYTSMQATSYIINNSKQNIMLGTVDNVGGVYTSVKEVSTSIKNMANFIINDNCRGSLLWQK